MQSMARDSPAASVARPASAGAGRGGDPYASRVGAFPERRQRLDPVLYGVPGDGDVLTPRQARAFRDDGYLVLAGLLSEKRVGALSAEMRRLFEDPGLRHREETITEPGSDVTRSVFRIHELCPVFRALARDPVLLDIARFILGDDVYLHQSRLNYKPGFDGREFYWHSDFETWHVEDGMPRMRAVSMSVLLSDNHEFNGPLMLVPGSHWVYLACVGETPEDHYKRSLKRQEYGVPDRENLSALIEEGGIAVPKGPAGSVIVFDCNMMHGSNGNITPYPRSNAFFVYNACSNRLVAPFGGRKPRPAFLAHRDFAPLRPL